MSLLLNKLAEEEARKRLKGADAYKALKAGNDKDAPALYVLSEPILEKNEGEGELFFINKKMGSVSSKNAAKIAAVWDTETTGYNGYIVSIAIILIDLETDRVIEEYYKEINPQIPIPADSSEIHGIYDEDVEDAPFFGDVWGEIEGLLTKADFFVGQNLSFDLAVLERELDRVDTPNPFIGVDVYDTMNLLKPVVQAKGKGGRLKDPTLGELVEFFGLSDGGVDVEYHNALVDTQKTAQVFLAAKKL